MRKRIEPEDTLATPTVTPRLTAMDVQQKEFGVTRVGGGYKMRDVDEFLDEITTSMTALVEENRRLKEQAGSGAMMGAPDLDEVSRQADEIIRRAREEAAQTVRDAQTAAAVAGAAAHGAGASDADRAQISAFLLRERAFLQGLAGLVQGHAEAVKGMVKDARARSAGAASQIAAPEHTPQAAPPATPPADTPIPAPPPVPMAPSTDEPQEPVRVDDPEPAALGRQEGTEDGPEVGDRSLRDLFWGED
ncbi:MAG: DivIVA domain-containing protein [Actinomycetota bacterium]